MGNEEIALALNVSGVCLGALQPTLGTQPST